MSNIEQIKQQFYTILSEIKHPKTGLALLESESLVDISFAKGEKWHILLHSNDDRTTQIEIEANIRMILAKKKISLPKFKLVFQATDKKLSTEEEDHTDKKSPTEDRRMGIPDRKSLQAKHVIGIASGKGGVGKSTVSANLSYALIEAGYKVGILDADIYGPSIGTLLGIGGQQAVQVQDDLIIPMQVYNLKVMSFSFLINQKQAVVWRGPMLGKALNQFLFDTKWGELDYLIIDLPPGTGDVQLSLSQLVQVDGIIIVTTPQNVAMHDAQRACDMFTQVQIPIIGVIENMSEFICPHCHKISTIFSQGGGEVLSEDVQVPLLGRIPLTVELMEASEKGIPILNKSIKKLKLDKTNVKTTQDAFTQICQRLTQQA